MFLYIGSVLIDQRNTTLTSLPVTALDTTEPPPYNLSIRWKKLRYGPSLPCEVCQNKTYSIRLAPFVKANFLKKCQEFVDLQNKLLF